MAAKKPQELTVKEMGARGGKARAKNLNKKQMSEIGRKGARARWTTTKKGAK
jgi:general stress protein YciG